MSTQQSNEGGETRNVDLIITDCRDSTWRKVPAEKRIQKDWKFNVSIISANGSTSFKNLCDEVAKKSKTAKFEICTPDFVQITAVNILELGNQANLILRDKGQTKFPFTYKQKYSTVPHTRAVTDQTGKFYGSPEHNAAAFALAELVDNALAATVGNDGERVIEIRFHEDGPNSCLVVLDNGSGMNSETLRPSLKFKAPKEDRDRSQILPPSAQQLDPPEDPDDEIHPLYINSDISKFGAGLKHAVFYLGNETRIMTKTKDNENVCEVNLSKRVMEAKELVIDEDPWEVETYSGSPGEIRDVAVNDNKIIKEIIQEEITKSDLSFTHIIVQNICQGDANSPYLLLRRRDTDKVIQGPSIETQLGHIYYYYLHGRSNATLPNPVQIWVKRFDARGKLVSSSNLRDLDDGNMLDLESKFVHSAAPDPFLFTIEVRDYNNSRKSDTNFKVGGIIRYHPFQYDRETNPVGIVARKQTDEDVVTLDDEGNSSEEGSQEGEIFGKSKEFFQIWWNGRLIPHTKLDSFNWCSPGERMKSTDQLFKPYGRISGSLFFNSKISEISENKLNLTTTNMLVEMFSEKKIGTQQSTFQRVTVKRQGNKELAAKRMTPSAKATFEEWLKKCKQWDKQVAFSKLRKIEGLVEPRTLAKKGIFLAYEMAAWENLKLKVGSAIKFKNNKPGRSTPEMVGIVKCFLVEKKLCMSEDGTELSKVHAPLSLVEVELQPAPYYQKPEEEGSTRIMEMRLIDTDTDDKVAKKIIAQQLSDLKGLKLKIVEPAEPALDENGESNIPLDGVLLKRITFDITKEDGTSVGGHLPYYEGKNKRNIFMVARVHKINEDGTYTLYNTSKLCQYLSKAYYFKNINLKEMIDLNEPGKFIITFRSYIEWNQPASTPGRRTVPGKADVFSPTQSRRVSSVDSSSRPKTPSLADSNTRVVDPAYEIEWNQEVDSLGKKIFNVDDELIRMPYYAIRFNIVAGPPHKFEIVEFGDEDVKLRIGQPFNITLSFKDSKGNMTYPTDWPPMLNQIPSISLVPNKKRPDPRLSFTSRDLVVRAQDRQLVVVDVVASGKLDGHEFQKDCKVEVGLLIDQNLRKSAMPRLCFYPGTPVKIACSTNHVQIENGSKVRLACQVLDVCDNIITRTQTKDKPILLDCQISKYKDINHREMELIYSYSILATSNDNELQEMDQAVELVELKTKEFPEMILSCVISLRLEGLEDSEPAIRSEPVQITVVPSTKPVKLKLYYQTSGDPVEIGEQSEIKCKVNEKLHLSYKLFDCLDNEIPFEENEHKIKLNWAEDIPGNGILPKLEIPKMAEHRRKITTSLKISGNTEKIRHDFFLTSFPRKPANLSVTFVGGSDTRVMDLPLGENIPNLIAKLTDRHGNVVKQFDQDELPSYVEVSIGEVIVDHQVVTDSEECNAIDGSFAIEQLKICSTSTNNNLPLGEITFTVCFKQQFQTTINLNVIPGPPDRFLLEINDEIQKDRGLFTTQNQSNIRTCIRLIDVAQNTTKPTENIQVTLSLKSVNDLVVLDKPVRQKAIIRPDGNGTVNFDGFVVAVKKQQNQKLGVPCRVESCGGKCYGKNVLIQVDAILGGKKVSGICYLHITCRSDIPSHLKIVNDGRTGKFSYKADSSFNYLRVTLEAEDESKYALAEKDHLTLILTRKDDPSGGQYECPAQNVREGVYTFGKVPTKAGRYNARFVYNNPTTNINIGQEFNEELEMTCGPIHGLLANKDVSNLSVSNDPNDVGSRVIVNDLILQVTDSFENPIQSAVGQLSLNTAMPCVELQNHDQFDSPIPISNGQVKIPPLILPPNLILNENIKHKIRFTAALQNNQKLSYDLEFWFYNDARKLEEIRDLKAKILHVEQELKTSSSTLDQVKKDLNLYKSENAQFKRNEDSERLKLSRIVPQDDMQNLRASSDIIGYENFLREDHQRLERERNQYKSNVHCGPGAGEQDVLGPIGLLAEISSDGGENCQQIQRVLSWHLQSQMKVVVVETEKKGHELTNRFPGEEFMVLEIVRDFCPTFPPLVGPGNPVYARSLLRFTNRDSRSLPSIEKVFNNILGKVIIIDDRPHATRFMKEYNSTRNGPSCPNILTRDGYLVRSSGIMGGSKNHVPENGNRYQLGLAPNPRVIEIQKIFQLLPSLKEAMVAREEVQVRNGPHIQELEEHQATMANKTNNLKTKLDKMKSDLKTLTGGQQNQQWNTLNNNVDGTPKRRTLRSSEANGRDEPFTKRPRKN